MINWSAIKAKYLQTSPELDDFVIDDVFEFIENWGRPEQAPDFDRIKSDYLAENSYEIEESDLDDIIDFIEKNITL